MDIKLSTGAIEAIINGRSVSHAILQLLGIRKMPTGDRMRLYLSDGAYSSPNAILATQLNSLVDSGELNKNAVIKVTRYVSNDAGNGRKMIIILDCEVLANGDEVGAPIGNPVNYEKEKMAKAENGLPASKSSTVGSGVQRNLPNSVTTTAVSSSHAQAPQGLPNVRPISVLTPYQNKWTICARVTSKSNIRTWSNSRGEGKLFSMDLLDSSGEIRATAFNAECDKFYSTIEVNNVYYISGATLKTANKQFSSLKNDYEMSFNAGTQVIPCQEDSSIPSMQFDFVTLDKLEGAAKDTILDVLAVCKETAEVNLVTQRSTGKELRKRDITLVDNTNRMVNLTLWGDIADKFDGSSNPVLAVKGAKVSDYNGISLTLLNSSSFLLNPELSEAHQLKGWWEKAGSFSSDLVNLSNQRGSGQGGSGSGGALRTIAEALQLGLGSRDQPEYYNCKAFVTLVQKERLMYSACPTEGCNKKVTDMGNGMYRCEKCQREFDNFRWRYMLSCNVADFTDNSWVSSFNDQAEALLGMTAQELGTLRDENPDMFHGVISGVTFKEFIFRFRVKMETFNDESRLKTHVMSALPVVWKDYNKRLLKEIKEALH